MGLFDRDDSRSQNSPEAYGWATERLRSKVERLARKVVDDAIARALAIEDRALARATEVEEDSRRKADEFVRESQDRAGQVLSSALHRAEAMRGATDTLEGELSKVISSFKQEIEALSSELRTAKEDLAASAATQDDRSREPQQPDALFAPEPRAEAEAAPAPVPIPEPEAAAAPAVHPEPEPSPAPEPAAALVVVPESKAAPPPTANSAPRAT